MTDCDEPATLAQAGRLAGLGVVTTFTSEDGGNVTAIFEKPETPIETAPAPLPYNADRIARMDAGREPVLDVPWPRCVRAARRASRGSDRPQTIAQPALGDDVQMLHWRFWIDLTPGERGRMTARVPASSQISTSSRIALYRSRP